MYAGDLNKLGALEAVSGIKNRDFSSYELMQACLNQIEKRESTVHAWVDFDPDRALNEAKLSDSQNAKDGMDLPLRGIRKDVHHND